jgi:hypothetical protein
MTIETIQREYQDHQRYVSVAQPGDPDLGPLQLLPGRWVGSGRGWNMIALPFARAAGSFLDYRLLLNQFDEELNFTLVDKAVPNRGVDDSHTVQTDSSSSRWTTSRSFTRSPSRTGLRVRSRERRGSPSTTSPACS